MQSLLASVVAARTRRHHRSFAKAALPAHVRVARRCRVGAAIIALALLPTQVAAQSYNWSTGTWDSAPAGQSSRSSSSFTWPGISSGGRNSVHDRRVVAFPRTFEPYQIVVSFSDRRLYHVVGRGRAISYPIAVPRPQSRWQGVERVSYKRKNPTWTPTARMRRENPELPRVVAGGDPLNPMGSRAIYLGNTLYRIHGTDAPWTIGKNVSRGCIRMHNAHVEELYPKVRSGMRVTSTWKRFETRAMAQASGSGGAGGAAPFDLIGVLFGVN
ncbi:MAG: L,D-transpeptidase [Pseudomonadota bacterium]